MKHFLTEKQKKEPLISVSLLLFNSKKYLNFCLRSLFAQSYSNLEVFISDNDSSDGSLEEAKKIVKEHFPSKKIFFQKNQNIGFAAGHNRIITRAKGKYILLLNPDVVLDRNFLKEAVLVLEKNRDVCGVQPRCLRLKISGTTLKKTNIIDSVGLEILKNRRIIARGQGRQARGFFTKQEEVFGLDGATPLYRKKALEDAKLCLKKSCEYLDEDFFMYKEDVDLAWRLRLLGWRAIYLPQVIAWHERGSGDSAKKNPWGIVLERQKINNLAKKLSFRNQRWMQIKNEGWGLFLRHFFWFFIKEAFSWLYFLIFEWQNRSAVSQMFSGLPRMLEKRKILRKRIRVKDGDLKKWFK